MVKQEKRTGSVIKEKNPKKKLENFVRASKLTVPEYLTVRKMFSRLDRNTKKWWWWWWGGVKFRSLELVNLFSKGTYQSKI